MQRTRYQRGTLETVVPAHGGRPERRLPRGQFWAQWYQYVRRPDGSERRRRREKIITRELAQKYNIALDHEGPLTKSDAQKVLDLLIAEESGIYVPPNKAATVAEIAKEYLELAKPQWGPHMVRTAGNLIEKHIIGGVLGSRRIVELTETDLQSWINQYVSKGASKSQLSNILLHLRAIWKHARKRKIMVENPTEDLKAKSKMQPTERYLTLNEVQRLLSELMGRDHLILCLFIQLGLIPEELFALKREDLFEDMIRIDEALVEGRLAPTKTDARNAFVYIPPALGIELRAWLECTSGEPTDWLFPRRKNGKGPTNAANYRNRVLKPAAIRAGIGVTWAVNKKGDRVARTDVDFRCLRRTCATLFGDQAKDPKLTQAQMRHKNPDMTLRAYQKAIPGSVKAAALALELQLRSENTEQVLNRQETQ